MIIFGPWFVFLWLDDLEFDKSIAWGFLHSFRICYYKLGWFLLSRSPGFLWLRCRLGEFCLARSFVINSSVVALVCLSVCLLICPVVVGRKWTLWLLLSLLAGVVVAIVKLWDHPALDNSYWRSNRKIMMERFPFVCGTHFTRGVSSYDVAFYILFCYFYLVLPPEDWIRFCAEINLSRSFCVLFIYEQKSKCARKWCSVVIQ